MRNAMTGQFFGVLSAIRVGNEPPEKQNRASVREVMQAQQNPDFGDAPYLWEKRANPSRKAEA